MLRGGLPANPSQSVYVPKNGFLPEFRQLLSEDSEAFANLKAEGGGDFHIPKALALPVSVPAEKGDVRKTPGQYSVWAAEKLPLMQGMASYFRAFGIPRAIAYQMTLDIFDGSTTSIIEDKAQAARLKAVWGDRDFVQGYRARFGEVLYDAWRSKDLEERFPEWAARVRASGLPEIYDPEDWNRFEEQLEALRKGPSPN